MPLLYSLGKINGSSDSSHHFKRHPFVIKSLRISGQLPKIFRIAWPLPKCFQSMGAGLHPSVTCQCAPGAVSYISQHSKVEHDCGLGQGFPKSKQLKKNPKPAIK